MSRVGLPQHEQASICVSARCNSLVVTGGMAPARASVEERLAEVLDGTIDPGRVFGTEVELAETATKPWTSARPSRSS